MNTICDLLISFIEVFAAMSPWLVAGFFAAGVIAVWIPRSWVNRVMGGSSGFSGIVGGAVVSAVGGDDASASAADDAPPASRGMKAILWQAYRRLLGSVVKALAIGLAISALVTVLVPDGFFAEAFGGRDWLAMPAMAIVGFPMYVCSTASIPIAASLILKGVSPGAAFVFLMVGPAMNAMSVTTVASLIGRKAAAAYVATIITGAVLCGCAVNFFTDASGAMDAARCASHGLTALHWASAAFLAAMMAYNLIRPVAMAHARHPHHCSEKT